MRKLVVSAITAALLVTAASVASAHAPCHHQDHTHWHWSFPWGHTDHYRYLRSESVSPTQYRDVYLVVEHGTHVRSGICP
jgi:hypothetical protein